MEHGCITHTKSCERFQLFYKNGKTGFNPEAYRAFIDERNKAGEVLFALYDVSLIDDILPFSQVEKGRFLEKKFKSMLRMGPLNTETDLIGEPRNTLWELNLLSRLRKGGINAELRDPNPDIFAELTDRNYLIQCKRLVTDSSRSLNRNIKNAVDQLVEGLKNEKDNTFGIIAISVEYPITKGGKMLVEKSEEKCRMELRRVLNEVKEKYGVFWRDPKVIKDRRIIAILLHLKVPSVVEEINLFSTGSQIDIHNTWEDGYGFQFIKEDFGSLR
ncbi:hypothetical protein KBD34_05330 [Patescibacteria group bacterium]|nr:hypothetical protein [Patescibacteria group bacterium]